MGLDMYLKAKKDYYRSEYNKDQTENDMVEKIALLTGLPVPDGSLSVEVTAVYWRKANQVHDWFVRNVQDGKDDCGEYYVSRDRLRELLAACNEALVNRNRADEILPTASGFFFGSTEYDEWYWKDIERTAREIKRVLALPEDVYFNYHSSW